MKKITISFISLGLLVLTIPACNNKKAENPEKIAKDIQSTTRQHTAGAVATTETGYYMKAVIDGKEWNASHMLPDESATSSYKTVHGEKGGAYINFQLWRQGMETGKTISFSEENAANLSVEDLKGFWSGKKGSITITTMDDQWTEGVFNFEATSSSNPGKTIVVTQGRFRVPLNTK